MGGKDARKRKAEEESDDPRFGVWASTGSHRLKLSKEMPLRLRLIEIGADVFAGGRSSGGGEAGSGCLCGADFGAVGRPPDIYIYMF